MQTLQNEDEVRRAVQSAFGADASPLLSLLRPSLRMTGNDGDPADAAVRLGGPGVLRADESWPTWNDQPLTFLAAVDCAAVAARFPESPLPRSGIVTAWVHRGPEYGAPEHLMGGASVHRDASRLVHIPDGVDLREVQPPEEVADATRSVRFPRLFRDVMWPINLFELTSDARLGLTRDHVDFADELEEAHAEIDPGGYDRSRIGGWPTLFNAAKTVALIDAGVVESRGRPDYRAEGAEAVMADADASWRPLLQLDADPDMGWNWFLDGVLMFLARPDDGPSDAIAFCSRQ